jgi:hypothetical protein
MNSTPNADTTDTSAPSEYLAALLAHQDEHDQVARRLADLDNAVKACETELTEAGSNIPNVDHLLQQREDLLADRAIGAASKADIDAIDAKIATETKAMTAAKATASRRVADAKQTLQGLQRKREQAGQALQDLTAASSGIVFSLIRNEMEQECERYVEAALAVKASLLRLFALEQMSSHFVKRGVGAVSFNAEMSLPFIRLPPCDGLTSSWHAARGVLFASDVYFSQQVERAVVAERELLASAGVTRYAV